MESSFTHKLNANVALGLCFQKFITFKCNTKHFCTKKIMQVAGNVWFKVLKYNLWLNVNDEKWDGVRQLLLCYSSVLRKSRREGKWTHKFFKAQVLRASTIRHRAVACYQTAWCRYLSQASWPHHHWQQVWVTPKQDAHVWVPSHSLCPLPFIAHPQTRLKIICGWSQEPIIKPQTGPDIPNIKILNKLWRKK